MTLQTEIEALWAARDTINSGTQGAARDAVETALDMLDRGQARLIRSDVAHVTDKKMRHFRR